MNLRSIAVVACILAAACGNDTSKNTVPVADMSSAPDSTAPDAGGRDVSMPDVSKPDMRPPNLDMGPDVAADIGGDMIDMEVPEPPIEITWPTDATDYANSANITYISSLVFPPLVDGMATCCFDYGARSKAPGLDNSFANLNQTLTGFGVNLNDILADSLTTGSLVALLDHRELDGPDDPNGFVLAWLRGEFEGGTTYAQAAAGTGTFLLDPDSLEPSGEAKLFFNPASMSTSQMAAGPAALSLLLPVLLSSLELRVEGARMSGDAAIGVDGVSYQNGTIAGYVAVREVFDNLNAIVDQQCSCLGAVGDFFTTPGNGTWSGQCVMDPEALGCTEELCIALGGNQLDNGGVCAIASTLLPQLADIDTDGDRATYEAISLGLQWEGAKGTIVGVGN